jgi:hypothetical protein
MYNFTAKAQIYKFNALDLDIIILNGENDFHYDKKISNQWSFDSTLNREFNGREERKIYQKNHWNSV